MSKIVIDDIRAQFASVNSINQRFKQVMDEFNSNVLYRNNPIGEPNDLFSDLDMGGFDIINIGELYKDGNPIIVPDLIWGNVLGNIEEQSDLWVFLSDFETRIAVNEQAILELDPDTFEARFLAIEAEDEALGQAIDTLDDKVSTNTQGLVDNNVRDDGQDIRLTTVEAIKLEGVAIHDANYTKNSFYVDATNAKYPLIALKNEVGQKQANTLVKLNSQGLVPNDQLPVTGAFNSKGIFTVAADPGPYDNPTTRGGLGPFKNGDVYAIAMPGAQTSGTVLAFTPEVGGPDVEFVVEPGDALLYMEDLAVPASTGWYVAYGNGSGAITAFDVAYDPTGNLIIDDPSSVTVDAALTDLDIEAERVRVESAGTLANKVNKAGDTMTGSLTVSNPSAASLIVARSNRTGDSTQVRAINPVNDDGVSLILAANGVISLRRTDGSGGLIGDLFSTGLDNQKVQFLDVPGTGIGPTQDDDLTRKWYVDTNFVSKIETATQTIDSDFVIKKDTPRLVLSSTDNVLSYLLFNDSAGVIRSGLRSNPANGDIALEARDINGDLAAAAILSTSGIFSTELATSSAPTDTQGPTALARKDYVDGFVVQTSNIANEAVTASKIADGAVVAVKIADGTITNPKIADGAVITSKIQTQAVTNGKVADLTLTGAKIANNALSFPGKIAIATSQAGSWVIAPDGNQIVPKGMFNVSILGLDTVVPAHEAFINGAWVQIKELPLGVGGMIISDGVNVRVVGSNVQTTFYYTQLF